MKRIAFLIAIAIALGFVGVYYATEAEACCGAYYDPVIQNLNCEPGELWPPNHKYRNIMVTADVSRDPSDRSDVTADWKVMTVTSDQPDDGDGIGDGETTNDCYVEVAYSNDPEIGGYGMVKARAERCGETAAFLGRGRTYTIVVQAWARGRYVTRTATASCEVYVPHDKGPNG